MGGAKGGAKGGVKGAVKGSPKGWKAKGTEKGADAKETPKGTVLPAKGVAKGKGSGKASVPPSEGQHSLSKAKTVQEIEAEMLAAKQLEKNAEKESARRDAIKQPLEAKGSHCEVRKHSEIGCAVVTMESEHAREVVLKVAAQMPAISEHGKEPRPEIKVNGIAVQLRPHFDKSLKKEVKTDIFIAWGRQAEKSTPLSAAVIAEAFDKLYREAQPQQFAAAALLQQQFLRTPGVLPPPPAAMPPSFLDFMSMGLHTAAAAAAHQYAAGAQPTQQQVAQAAMLAAAAMQQQVQLQQQQQLQLQQQLQQQQLQQVQSQQQQQQLHLQQAAASTYLGLGELNSMYADADGMQAPERKTMNIVDPVSGQPIDLSPARPRLPRDSEVFKRAVGCKPMQIIDPNSGSPVDTLGLNFAPRKPVQPWSIIDPQSGSEVRV